MIQVTTQNVGNNTNRSTFKKMGSANTNVFLEFLSTNFQPELELLLYSVRIHRNSVMDKRISAILNSDIDWEVFVKLALQHAVIPLAYRTLSEFSTEIPPPALDELKQLTHINSYHSLDFTRELLRLLTILESNGIKALPYKGPVLAEFLYEDVSLRQFGDLDILVAKKDILKTKKIFHSVGYFPHALTTEEQDQSYLSSGRPYNYKFRSGNGQVSVELHWKFTSKYNSFLIDYDHIMDDLISVQIADKAIPTLKPEELLLILSQHNSKHFWKRLLWICDVANLVQKYEMNWERVIKISTDAGAKRMLLLGLHLAQMLLNIPFPHDISEQIKSDRKVRKLALKVVKQFSSISDKPIEERFEAHLFSIEMRERWRDKLRYFVYHAMPSRLGKRLFRQ